MFAEVRNSKRSGFSLSLSYYFARKRNYPAEASFSLRVLWTALRRGFFALLIPIIIWGGIFGGVATATEVGGLAALAAIVIGVLIYRELTWKDFWKTIVDSAVQTSVIMLIVATSATSGPLGGPDGPRQHALPRQKAFERAFEARLWYLKRPWRSVR